MPRQARTLSKCGIYHIMLRGNERKNIFVDDEDKSRIINTIYEKKNETGIYIYAFCVMDNHLHLIIKENNGKASNFIKRIGTSYARYFNKKYRRVGHVFQDRYRSENIEHEGYLLSAIRYVHNNPHKSGLCRPAEYKWSSMTEYLTFIKGGIKIPEIEDVVNIFSLDSKAAIRNFFEYSKENVEDKFIDIEDNVTDNFDEEYINEFVKEFLKKFSIEKKDLRKREYKCERIKLIIQLCGKFSLSSRCISKITGIDRETVRRIMLSKEPFR